MAPGQHNFYCDLCQKGYARQNEFAAHETSYEHQHAERLTKLKKQNAAMARKDTADTRAKPSGGMTIKPINMPSSSATGPKGPKKGFKTAFAAVKDETTGSSVSETKAKELESDEAKQLNDQIKQLREKSFEVNRRNRELEELREAEERKNPPVNVQGVDKSVWDHSAHGCRCRSKSERAHVWYVRDKKMDYWPWNRGEEYMKTHLEFDKMREYREQEKAGEAEWKTLIRKLNDTKEIFNTKFGAALEASERSNKPKDKAMQELVDKIMVGIPDFDDDEFDELDSAMDTS